MSEVGRRPARWVPTPRTLALAALVCLALLVSTRRHVEALLVLGPVLALSAVVAGHVARRAALRSPSDAIRSRGVELALAWTALALWLVLGALLAALAIALSNGPGFDF